MGGSSHDKRKITYIGSQGLASSNLLRPNAHNQFIFINIGLGHGLLEQHNLEAVLRPTMFNVVT